MLITLPDSDDALRYLSTWSKNAIDLAEKNGIKVNIVKGKNVTKSHIINDIKSKNPRFINFNGHGSEISIHGQNNEALITLGENDSLLKNRFVHSISCDSARELGAKCRAKAFIGYSNAFIFSMDKNSLSRPLEDNFAKPTLESAFEVPIQIVKRKTAKEAFEQSQKKYQQWIDEYTFSESKYTAEELLTVLPCLHWNKTFQIAHGDPEAKLD